MQTEELYKLYLQFPSVQTDTRKLKKGDLFFALKGDNFNGNKFAAEAKQLGAVRAIVDDPSVSIPDFTIQVPDVLLALQQLAQHHRKQFTVPVLAITGSNGKTTTKELIHAVLSAKFKTYTTEGNLNNQIGIPLTLLKVKADAEMIIVEMGANHIGEIASYCSYVLPTHGLITNAGKAHLEGFGSVEGVRKGKGELFDYLRGREDSNAFVMWDYEYLRDMSKGISGIFKYGTGADVHIRGAIKQSAPFLEVHVSEGVSPMLIRTKLVGDYNLPNVLAAVAVGKVFEVEENKIRECLEQYTPSNSRSQWMHKDGNNIILDAYNANPSSMKAAIENYARLNVAEKVLVLGAMAELGDDSIHEHEDLVRLIESHNWKEVILVGGDFLKIKHPFISMPDALATQHWLQKQNYKGVHLLVKGSRSMKMEQVIS